MNRERDKFLTEMMGKCWHESAGMVWICGNCKTDIGWRVTNKDSVDVESLNPNFSTWEGFGKLWEFAIKQEWWKSFIYYFNNFSDRVPAEYCEWILFERINPDCFANAVYEFLKDKK